MRLWSDSWPNGEPIPERHAAARLRADGSVEWSDNLSPPLAWRDLPVGTRSLVLMCQDFDMPGRLEDTHPPDRELAAALPRREFFHWVLVDLPPTLSGLAEGEVGRGFLPGGKPGPAAVHGGRHGLNDFTTWFAGDVQRAGQYFGYDGPCPPVNDSLVHHCVFALFALSAERLPIDGVFTGLQVREAMAGLVLDSATHSGTFTLNRRLRGPAA